ncbi:MAG: TonB-dependent receptor [Bacteroidetes bacterium]|nr:MAG: TonB-dependent receptor [Bacteroidota bacterium]
MIQPKKFILASLLIGWGTAHAQIDTDTLRLSEVQVQDSRTPVRFSESGRNITVLLSEELRSMPALNVQDILSYLNSIDVRQRGVGGVQADISLRGGSFDQCLVLIDGVKLSDPQTGHHLLNLPIHPSDIERIEVLRGPGSRIFGQNAFAGAINIITKKDYSNGGRAEVMAGDFQTWQYGAGINFKLGERYGNRISFVRTESAGYSDNRDFANNQLWYQSNYKLSNDAQLTAMFGWQAKDFGAQHFYTPPVAKYREYEETDLFFGNLSGQFVKLKNLKVNLNWRQHSDEFRLWRDSLHKGINLHTSDVFSADFNMSHESKLGTSSWGAEIRQEQINSSNLGDRSRLISGLFVEHRFIKWQRINAVIGTNVSYIQNFGWVAYPGMDVSYDLNSSSKLYVSTGRSYRVPTFTDLYYTDAGPSSLGNPNLAPEAAFTYEAGYKWTKRNLYFGANYFYRNASSLIDWQRENTSTPWKAINVSNVYTQGAELEANMRFEKGIVKRIRMGYSWIDVSKIQTEQISRYVYDFLKHQIVLSSEFRLHKRVSLGIFYRYQERMSYTPAHILDASLNIQFKKFTLRGQVENLTETNYFGSTYVQMPLRWFRTSLSYQF